MTADLDPAFADAGVLDRLADMVTDRVGRVHSRPIHPDAIIPGDLVLMVTDNGRQEMITVERVDPSNIHGRPARGYALYFQKDGREWDLVYRPQHPTNLQPYLVREWQRPALQADGYFS